MGDYDASSLEEFLGDLNGDGTINVQDIVLIVNIILSNWFIILLNQRVT